MRAALPVSPHSNKKKKMITRPLARFTDICWSFSNSRVALRLSSDHGQAHAHARLASALAATAAVPSRSFMAALTALFGRDCTMSNGWVGADFVRTAILAYHQHVTCR